MSDQAPGSPGKFALVIRKMGRGINRSGKVKCKTVIRELTNYMEGRLSESLQASIEDHIKSCQNCSAQMETIRKMLDLVGDQQSWLNALEQHVLKKPAATSKEDAHKKERP